MNNNDLVVTCTKPYKKVVFTWATMEECTWASIGASDEDIDELIAAKGHEGADVAGWHVTVA